MEHTERIAERLRTIGQQLLQLAADIAGDVEIPEFPADAQRRIEDGLCLICENPWVKRGLCDKHYQRVDRRLKKNPEIEAELIRLGKIAPKPGTKPGGSALEEALQNLAKDEIKREKRGK